MDFHLAFQDQSTAGEVPYETRYCSAIDSNVEMEDQAYARNDEKRETDETADDRDEVLCGYSQADDEGFGAEECCHDELQNEAVGQKEGSLLSHFPSGFITP